MRFAQTGYGVEIISPLGILILVVGIIFTIGLPIMMIKYGKKGSDQKLMPSTKTVSGD